MEISHLKILLIVIAINTVFFNPFNLLAPCVILNLSSQLVIA